MFRKATMTMVGVVLAALFCFSTSAYAKSVQDYESMRPADQSAYLINYLDKMISDIGQKNPALAQQIKDYFFVSPPGKPDPEGLFKFHVELAAVDNVAKEGKADLSKIDIETLVVSVVKQKFAPPAKQ